VKQNQKTKPRNTGGEEEEGEKYNNSDVGFV
jgi:hypothetical protein